MNVKIAIPTTIKCLDSFRDYIEASGYQVEIHELGLNRWYYSPDAPGYGQSTPFGLLQAGARRSAFVFIRLPAAA